jgi:leucyl-tRNA synthetase
VTEEEKKKHEAMWVPEQDVAKTINVIDGPYIWQQFLHPTAMTDEGIICNSDFLNDLTIEEAAEKIIDWLEKNNFGNRKVQFKLRDWVFSRQRYWGEPIPLVYCEACAKNHELRSKNNGVSVGEGLNPGWIPLPKTELPLKLPPVEKYEPTDTGESPLSKIENWVNTKCPQCGGPARRETDTMPNWAGSSWYFLRYADPHNKKDFFKDPSFKFCSEIEATEKDQVYFAEFKNIYENLEKINIKIWAVNRLLLNGINRALWLPLRTVAVMIYEKDLQEASKYLENQSYVCQKKENFGWYFEKNDVKVELIPVFQENGKLLSYTPQGAVQAMIQHDLPATELGRIFDFSYRTVSPEYNLAHYKFISEHEKDDRKGLGDDQKIIFLEEWVKSKNDKLLYWNQVDWYNGGMEHTVLHLLYSRFWNQFLFDIGLVPVSEPYKKRTSHGMILAKGGEKMSKSRGNVVNPDEMIEKFSADALRTYIMFMGPFDQAVEWDTNGLVGMQRFLDRVWGLQEKLKQTTDDRQSTVDNILHQTIKKVTENIETMRFNTAISSIMVLVNELSKQEVISSVHYSTVIQLLYAFAPHLTSEVWHEVLGNTTELDFAPWPKYNPDLIQSAEMELAIQVNGKLRDTIVVESEASEEDVKQAALASEKIQKWLDGKESKKIIYVKGKLVSIVI